MEDQAILERLREVNLESVWAELQGLGYVNQFMADLQVLRPDLKMVGRARTVRFLPLRPDLAKTRGGPALNSRAAEETEPGDILVVDACGVRHAGFLGDVIATRFLVREGAGMVVDGAIRDWGVLREMVLPLYVRAAHASGTGTHLMGADYQVPIHCGGVTVVPGDLLLGDPEGVIVLPRALAEPVIAAAEETDAKERFLRRKLTEENRSLYECYPPTPEILAEFERTYRKG